MHGLCARMRVRRYIMGVVTVEGVVEHGQIRLKGGIRLPDKMRVYVVVPDLQVAHVYSPRLLDSEQTADFEMEIVEAGANAGL
jgi:hypothetical protein